MADVGRGGAEYTRRTTELNLCFFDQVSLRQVSVQPQPQRITSTRCPQACPRPPRECPLPLTLQHTPRVRPMSLSASLLL